MDGTALILLPEALVSQARRRGFRLIPLETSGQTRFGLFYFDFSRLAKELGLDMEQAFYLETDYDGVFELDNLAARLMAGEEVGPGASQLFRPGTRVSGSNWRGTVLGWSAFGRRLLFAVHDYSPGACNCPDRRCLWNDRFAIPPNYEHQPQGWPFRVCQEPDGRREERLRPQFLEVVGQLWPAAVRQGIDQRLDGGSGQWRTAFRGLIEAVRLDRQDQVESADSRTAEDVLEELAELWRKPEVQTVSVGYRSPSGLCLSVRTRPIRLASSDGAIRDLGRYDIMVCPDGSATGPLFVVTALDRPMAGAQHPLIDALGCPIDAGLNESLTRLVAERQYALAAGLLVDYLTEIPPGRPLMVGLEAYPTVETDQPPQDDPDKPGLDDPNCPIGPSVKNYLKEFGYLPPNQRQVQARDSFRAAQRNRRQAWEAVSGRLAPNLSSEEIDREFERLMAHPDFLALLPLRAGLACFTRPLTAGPAEGRRNFGCQVVLMDVGKDGPTLQVAGLEALDDGEPLYWHPLVSCRDCRPRLSDDDWLVVNDCLQKGRLASAFELVVAALQDEEAIRRNGYVAMDRWPEAPAQEDDQPIPSADSAVAEEGDDQLTALARGGD